ncbi:hypothetical protein ABFS83_07G052100 [Erythranthe nasuta]
MKKDAWKLVKEKSGAADSFVTKETYFSAMGRVEQDARNSYDDPSVDLMTGSRFRKMMIVDGCFFLHLALLLLGAADHLGYPVGHGVFGRGRSKGDVKHWIKAMTFVGNQIPIVVLKELMKQTFFQRVVTSQRKWDEPNGIFRRALYEFLIFQAPSPKSGRRITIDLLHNLQGLVLGSGPKPDQTDEDIDLESDITTTVIVNIDDDGGQGFLSATHMERVGIRLKKQTRGGTKGIKFTTNIFGASLYLPCFAVDDDTDLVFRSLIDYEKRHVSSSSSSNRPLEVMSYLRLMKDLVRSPEDIRLLEKRGIVTTCDLRHKEKLLRILGWKLHGNCITPELDTVRLLTRHYSSPAVWGNLKNFLGIVISFFISFALMFGLTSVQTYSFALMFGLTSVQTYYAAYQHYHPDKKQ